MSRQRQTSNKRTQQRFIGTQAPFIHSQDFQIAKYALKVNMEGIQRYLAEELGKNETYCTMWNIAEMIFTIDVKRGIYEVNAPREYYIAIIAYSLEDEGLRIYEDFNSKTRQVKDLSSWDAFPYKSLYCLLIQSVKYVKSVPDARAKGIKLYRGLNFDFPCQVNESFSFGQIASFSASKKIAKEFSMGSGTVFEILPPVQPNTTLGIVPYSFIKNEEEVLVMPWSKFVVKQIIKEKKRVILESVDNEAVEVED